MSIIVSGIRLPIGSAPEEATALALKKCQLNSSSASAAIYRRSVDARHGHVTMVYSVILNEVSGEEALVTQLQLPTVRFKPDTTALPTIGTRTLVHRPVVVGFGPAGLFAAYTLAQYGYCPVVWEQGDAIEMRDEKIAQFLKTGALDVASNIQFGEGGAGTYSDGKLTTRINDPLCDTVLHILVLHGAPTDILQQAKPHIGTDILKNVVRSMRSFIIAKQGEVHFRTALTGLTTHSGRLSAVVANGQEVACERAVLAVGHSARTTFETLYPLIEMEPKSFSVGARIEHLQTDIDQMLYGNFAGHPQLPPAEYTLSHRADGRAVYSFCMCPGGQVVAAQSETHSIVTNGMSYHARNGKNANSALVVSVDPSDFPDRHPLSGIAFQRQLEQAAYRLTNSDMAPCQRVADLIKGQPTKKLGRVHPTYPRGINLGSIEPCLPPYVNNQLRVGLQAFERKLKGFSMADALLTAPETRTSSPIRIPRGEDLFSRSLPGLLPCGEGAGYAGGIMSAAVDGIRAAYQIMKEFAPQ